MKEVRVMLADKYSVVRAGLLRTLEQHHNITVIGEVSSGEQAYQEFTNWQPDILIMNIALPNMSGLETLRRILTKHSKAQVIMFSMDENITLAAQSLTIGALAYLAMSEDQHNLIDAIAHAAEGQNFLTSQVAQKIALQSTTGQESIVQTLTSREFEIFRLIVEGAAIENVAQLLKISQKTVANYQTILKHKLGIHSPIELVRLAIKHGIIESCN